MPVLSAGGGSASKLAVGPPGRWRLVCCARWAASAAAASAPRVSSATPAPTAVLGFAGSCYTSKLTLMVD